MGKFLLNIWTDVLTAPALPHKLDIEISLGRPAAGGLHSAEGSLQTADESEPQLHCLLSAVDHAYKAQAPDHARLEEYLLPIFAANRGRAILLTLSLRQVRTSS